MAAHKNRKGDLLLSFACRAGDHGEDCDDSMAALDGHMVCHCDCHNRDCHKFQGGRAA